MEKLFKLKEHGTDVRTEIMAGITIFMTMAYILAVNPGILSASGMDSGAVFTATALASAIGCACMAFFANLPFALSAGMGLNAYFAYTVVIGMGYSWEMALTAVFAEGLLFIILSVTNVREAIFNAISNLQGIYERNPMCYFLQLLIESKRDEIIQIFSQGEMKIRTEASNVMKTIDPSQSSRYDAMLQNKGF